MATNNQKIINGAKSRMEARRYRNQGRALEAFLVLMIAACMLFMWPLLKNLDRHYADQDNLEQEMRGSIISMEQVQ